MTVDIKRGGKIQSYTVPDFNEAVTVMQVLDHIYEELDHTLAYFRHSACAQGICGRCLVKVDGKAVLACTAKIEAGTVGILVENAGKTVVRDLVFKE